MPEISVIVPVYNVKDYLEPCVNSLMLQDFRDFELILVEDGSTDGSLALCERLQKGDACIRLLRHQRNLGLSAARNTGMDAARGRYLVFVDGDDLMLSNGLRVLYEAAEATGAEVVYNGQYYIPAFAEGSHAKVVGLTRCTKEIYAGQRGFLPEGLGERLEAWLNRSILDTAWNKLYRRDFMEKHSLRFDEGISTLEDLWFFFRVLCLAPSIAMVPEVFYLYRENPSSIRYQPPTPERLQTDLRNLMEGCRLLSSFMDSMEFFLKNPQIRSMVMECAIRVCMGRVADVYAAIPPHELYESIQEALVPVFGENAPFVTGIFQLTGALYAGCVQLIRETPESPRLWIPELMTLAHRLGRVERSLSADDCLPGDSMI